MTTLSLAGFIWSCELIATANMGYQSARIAYQVYNSSKAKFTQIIEKIKHYGGTQHEPDWIIIDPSKPEGWEASEEAFPIDIQSKFDEDEDEKKVVVDVYLISQPHPTSPALLTPTHHHC
tara:strand:+ start:357 stop:716 length:360 start_codon:yes stop_codon:yes gene_type:complete